jgi:Ca-activated chloride channel family protein
MNIQRSGDSTASATLSNEERFAGNRDLILEYRLTGDRIQSGLLLSDDQDERHFLLMVQPPSRVAPAQIPAREYVFVLDVSGSMEGFPIETAKTLLQDLVKHLRPTDSFNVVLFAGDTQLFSPRSLPATASNVKRAFEMIESQRGGGGTELQAALETTLGLPRQAHVSRSVVIITDGYIAQERGAFELIEKNLHETNVFAFGIGSGVNRYLIEGLARTGRGEPFVATDEFEALEVAKKFRRYIESPVLTNVQVRMHGFDAYDIEPLRQPDLFAERPIVVIGKWRGTRGGEIEVTGRTTSGAFSSKHAVSEASVRAEHAALPRLWARSRIARLSDFDVSGTDERSVAEVTSLGLRYSLLTQHTSFIAVLEQVRNREGGAENVDQPLPLPMGVSNLAVGDGYAMGAEPEFVWLLALLLGALALVRVRRGHGRRVL